MKNHKIQDILQLVEMPSRYLGSEINSVHKPWDTVPLKIVLAFPDLYEIGMSHFGIQILYHIFNQHPSILCERVFAPASDMLKSLQLTNQSIVSLESKRPLLDFNIVGFSLQYELTYTNILMILERSGIPFLAKNRNASHPLIIAGGPCTSNPEPLADFFDAMVIGDGEAVILKMAAIWLEWNKERGNKVELLKQWSKLEGVYIPSFFEPEWQSHESGVTFQVLRPLFDDYTQVKRTIVSDLNSVPFPIQPIVAFGKPVHDRLRIEISRGCSRGCRFCQAGMIYRPVRERSIECIKQLVNTSLKLTGYEDISLLSLSTGDYSGLSVLMTDLIDAYGLSSPVNHPVALSFPSIRADRLNSNLMNLIKQVRKTGFTIAPEAGTQRLRDVINKQLNEKEIIETVTNAFELGWQVIKLYFMIGLPTETWEDIEGIVDLVKRLSQMKAAKGKKKQINVSISSFVPKPHTPFQWSPQMELSVCKQKIHWLKDHLNQRNIQMKWQNPEMSTLEGLWARGDRRLSSLLIRAYQKGCVFDSWSEQFNDTAWEDACCQERINPLFYTSRIRNVKEPLPWDHIDTRISKAFLIRELNQSVKTSLTHDCRYDTCTNCGVCDFKRIHPIHFKHDVPQEKDEKSKESGGSLPSVLHRYQIHYTKAGLSKFFSHLELMHIFTRAFRRADIPVKYSSGFHPKLQISFEDALPIGMESYSEYAYFTTTQPIDPLRIRQQFNNELPSGIQVRSCSVVQRKPCIHSLSYLVNIGNSCIDINELLHFNESSEWIRTKIDAKGQAKTLNLKQFVKQIQIFQKSTLKMHLMINQGKMLRPIEVLKFIFKIPDNELKQVQVIKLKSYSGE
ncbi:MAG: TIGR03960 family B12-binding radical SAM protein [Desulfobacterales bacterium]|nr:TIGR03960 family B12-binding radical SAM protein [Desulfobacterales bacterium]